MKCEVLSLCISFEVAAFIHLAVQPKFTAHYAGQVQRESLFWQTRAISMPLIMQSSTPAFILDLCTKGHTSLATGQLESYLDC